LLAEIARIVLESGYRWLAEYVKTSLDKLQSGAADDFYSYLRTLFSEQIVENLWLYAIVDKKGIYIPDTIARHVAIKHASQKRLNISRVCSKSEVCFYLI